MKNKLGSDIYESWLRKIDFVEEMNNYILLSVSTRFIRDWITSRYLDQILQIVKKYKKDLTRIEFKIIEKISKNETQESINAIGKSENISLLKTPIYNITELTQIKNLITLLLALVTS